MSSGTKNIPKKMSVSPQKVEVNETEDNGEIVKRKLVTYDNVKCTSFDVSYRPSESEMTSHPNASDYRVEPQLKMSKSRQTEISDQMDNLPEFEMVATTMYCMSYEEMKKISECDVNKATSTPGHGTLSDPRMGTTRRDTVCGTCELSIYRCPAHFGIIHLNKQYIHPMFINPTIHLLESVCNNCGKLLISPEAFKHYRLNEIKNQEKLLKRLAAISKEIPIKNAHSPKCPPNPTYEKPKSGYIICYNDLNSKTKERLVEDIYKIFDAIPEDQLSMIKFSKKSHPTNWCLKGLPVIPPIARPIVFIDGVPKEDYLTVTYISIIKENNKLSVKQELADRKKIEANLFFYISHLFDNTDKKNSVKGRSDNPDGIRNQLSTKKGLLRKNGMGKRVDYSARTVIGPGGLIPDGKRHGGISASSKIDFGYIGVPNSFKKDMTIPERVTRYNYPRIIEMHSRGEIKSLQYKTKYFSTVQDLKDKNFYPQIGDTVNRTIMEGDPTLFGRQPSLHKYSLNGVKCVNHDDENFKVTKEVNQQYNADFDGDEMSMHFVQTPAARTETLYVSSVDTNQINNQSNGPVLGPNFNSLLAAFLMTKDWGRGIIKIPEYLFADILNALIGVRIKKQDISKIKDSYFSRCNKVKVDPYLGSSIFSLCLPENMFYRSGHGNDSIEIKNGILVSGTINKDKFGIVHGSLVQVIFKMYGHEELTRFLTISGRICDWFIIYHKFSIGYSACYTNRDEIIKSVKREAAIAQQKVYQLGEYPTNAIDLFFFNKTSMEILSNLKTIGKNVGEKYFKPNNPFNVYGKENGSGTKGTDSNKGQIAGSVATQFWNGNFPPYTMNDKTRVIEYFLPKDNSIESRGYIVESFMDGISPEGEFFHMAASRYGIMDTANNTAVVGHLHRDITKSMEYIFLNNDGFVVSVTGKIFQFSFGDCFDVGSQLFTSFNGEQIVNFIDIVSIVNSTNAEYSSTYLDNIPDEFLVDQIMAPDDEWDHDPDQYPDDAQDDDPDYVDPLNAYNTADSGLAGHLFYPYDPSW